MSHEPLDSKMFFEHMDHITQERIDREVEAILCPSEPPPVLLAPEDPLALLRSVLWGLVFLTGGIFGAIGVFKLGYWIAAHF